MGATPQVQPDFMLDEEVMHKHYASEIELSTGQTVESVVVHDKGYYATSAALVAAYPVANNGDYAIIGTTDTVWVWDGDTNTWRDGGVSLLEVTKTNANNADNILQITDGNTGRKIKDYTGTGIVKLTAGVPSIATPKVDYNDNYTSSIIDWNPITPTAITAGSSTTLGSAVFTGTFEDTLKYSRSLFRCRSAAIGVTCSSSTGLLFDKGSTHGHKDGDIVYVAAAVLPTGITAGRPYYMVSTTANTFKLTLTPGGAAIAYTDAGTTVTAVFVVHGYIDSASISGTDVTLNLSLDYDLTTIVANFTNYEITRIRKIYDFQEYIYTGAIEVTADASNPQGRRIMDIKRPMYLQSVNSSIGTAATGSGKLQWWIGTGVAGANPTTNLYSSATAQDMTTAITLNYRRPTLTKYIPSGNNVALVIQDVGGTIKPAFLQVQLYLIPIDLIAL